MVRADRDVLRVRAPEADDDGSFGIDRGVELVQHARDMLASAACAAFDPRRAYHLKKVQRAEDYMRHVRLGQTEHGSFVVTLLAPMPPAGRYLHRHHFGRILMKNLTSDRSRVFSHNHFIQRMMQSWKAIAAMV